MDNNRTNTNDQTSLEATALDEALVMDGLVADSIETVEDPIPNSEELDAKEKERLAKLKADVEATDGLQLAALSDGATMTDASGMVLMAPAGTGAAAAAAAGAGGGLGAGATAGIGLAVLGGGAIILDKDDKPGSTSSSESKATNSDPVAAANAPRTAQEGAAALTGTLVASDADGDDLTFSSSSNVSGFTLNENGSYSFNPSDGAYDDLDAGQVRFVTVNYTVADGAGGTDTGSLQIILVGTNDAPQVAAQQISATEGGTLASGRLQATDADGDSLQFVINGTTPAGFVLQPNGAFVFNPANPAYDGLALGDTTEEIVSFTVIDGNGGSATSQLTITVTGTNDAPVVSMAAPIVAIEDGAVISGQLVATDDGDGALVYSLAANQAAVEGLQLNSNGSYSFDPSAAGYNGLALGVTQVQNVRYVATDSQGASAEGTLQITIVGSNDQPVVNSAQLAQSEGDTVFTGSLTATDVDGDFLVFSANNLPDGFTLLATGDYVFDPAHPSYNYLAAGEELPVLVNFEVSDGRGGQQSGTLEITVTGTNDAPVVGFVQSQSTTEDNVAIITGTVATNVSDADASDVLEYRLADPANTIDGFVLNADGSYTFTPASDTYQALGQNDTQQLEINFIVSDGNGGETAGSLQIGIIGINDAPVALGETVDAGAEDAVLDGDVIELAGDVLAENDYRDVDNQGEVIVRSASANGAQQQAILQGSTAALAPLAIQGTYGVLYIASNGEYNYIAFNQALLNANGGADATRIEDDLNLAPGSIGNVVATAIGLLDSQPGGVSAQDVFGYNIADPDGGLAAAQLVFAYTGQDDPSTVTDSTTDTQATEAGDSVAGENTASGQVSITDIDQGENGGPFQAPANGTLNQDGVTYTVEGIYGTFTFVPNDGANTGTWTYTLDQGRKVTQALNVVLDQSGDPVPAKDTLVATTQGGTEYPITVNVFGSNDAPTVTAAMALNGVSAAVTEGDTSDPTVVAGALNGGNSPAIGNLITETAVTDVDGDVITVTGITNAPNSAVVINQAGGFDIELSFGGNVVADLSIAADGSYSLSMRETAAQSMTDADVANFAFAVTLSDDMGVPVNVPFNIALNGATDAFAAVNDAASVSETADADTSAMPVNFSAIAPTGQLLTNDAATTDSGLLPAGAVVTSFTSAGNVTAGVATGSTLATGTATGLAGQYGELYVDSSGAYYYRPVGGDVDALGVNSDPLSETFTYTVTNADGSTSSATLTITINGANDTPTVAGDTQGIAESQAAGFVITSAEGGQGSNLLTDPALYADREGQAGRLTNVESDNTSQSQTILAGSQLSFDGVIGNSIAVRTITGEFGTLEIAADGNYRYTANSPVDNAITSLAQGQTVTDVFTYTVVDTGVAGTPVEAQLVFEFRGENDAPVVRFNPISFQDEDFALQEDAVILFDDPDGDTLTYTVDTPVAGFTLIDANGDAVSSNTTGQYRFDTNHADYQYLETDQQLSVPISITATDPYGESATATETYIVVGTNDTPVAYAASNSVDEDAAEVLSGQISITNPNGDPVDADERDQLLADNSPDNLGLTFNFDAPNASATIARANGTTEQVAGQVLTDIQSALTLRTDGSYELDNNAAVIQALALGDTLTIKQPYTISDDEHATSASENLTITVTGANDAPTVTDAGIAVKEDDNLGNGRNFGEGNLLTAGPLGESPDGTAADVDDGATLRILTVNGDTVVDFAPTTITGAFGSLVINPNGIYSYDLDNANDTVQALTDGSTETDTFTVVVSDEHGATAEQTLTVTINGATDVVIAVDDAPELAIQEANADTGGTSPATGNVLTNDATTADDRDAQNLLVNRIENQDGAQASVADTTLDGAPTVINGEYGTLTIAGNGDYRYDINQGNTEVNELEAGDQITDTFIYTLASGDTANLVITISGGNDVPTADAVSNVVAEDSAPASFDGNFIAESNANDVDGDNSLLRLSSVDGNNVPTGGSIPDPANVDVSASGAIEITGSNGGTLVVASNGDYVYTPPGSLDVQALRANQDFSESFAVTLTDENGATVNTSLNFAITGQNDLASFDGLVGGSVFEASTVADGSELPGLPTTGPISLVVRDADTDEAAFVGVLDGMGGIVQSLSGAYGTFSLDIANNTWEYVLDNSRAITQELTGFDLGRETFAVQSVDGSTVIIGVDVVGAGDAAQFTHTVTNSTLTEDGGVANADTGVSAASGTLTFTDQDAGHGNFASTTAANGALAGTYGTFTFDDQTGDWTYQLDNSAAATQNLNAGEAATDTLTVTTSGSDTFDIVVNITGSNDAAVITNTTTDTAVTEDDSANAAEGETASGTLSVTDVDQDASDVANGLANQETFQAAEPADLVGTYGNFTFNEANGEWTYSIAAGQQTAAQVANLQALPAGAQEPDSLTVLSQDGTAHTITVTVDGANDAPVVAAVTNTADEANGHDADGQDTGGSDASGNLLDAASDVDNGATRSVLDVNSDGAPTAATPIVVVRATGTLTVNVDGSYDFVVNNDEATVQALADMGSIDEVYNFAITDGIDITPSTLTITINGASDVVTAVNDENSIDEDAVPANVTGNVLTNDALTDDDETIGFTPDGAGAYTEQYVSRVEGAVGSSNVVNGTTVMNGSVIAGNYGNLVMGADGDYRYELDNSNPAVNQLHDNSAPLQETFVYTMSDASGTHPDSSANLVITINGTNDAPTVVADDQAIEADDVGTTDYAGNVLTNDSDIEGHALRVGRAEGGVGPQTVLNGAIASSDGNSDLSPTIVAGMFGTLYIGSNGDYRYELDRATHQAAFNELDDGEVATDVFSIEVFDEQGGSSVNTLTVTVNGVADAPVITVNAADLSAIEENGITLSGLTDGAGNVVFSDADNPAGDEIITVMLTPSIGSVAVSLGAGVTNVTPGTAAPGVLVLSGTLTDINEMFAGTDGTVVYNPVDNYNGAVTVGIEANDGVLISTDQLELTVNAVTDVYDADEAADYPITNFDTGEAAASSDVLDVTDLLTNGVLFDGDGDSSNGFSYIGEDAAGDPNSNAIAGNNASNAVFAVRADGVTADGFDTAALATLINDVTVDAGGSYVILVDVDDAEGFDDVLVFSGTDESVGVFVPADGTLVSGELSLQGGLNFLGDEGVTDLTDDNFNFAP